MIFRLRLGDLFVSQTTDHFFISLSRTNSALCMYHTEISISCTVCCRLPSYKICLVLYSLDAISRMVLSILPRCLLLWWNFCRWVGVQEFYLFDWGIFFVIFFRLFDGVHFHYSLVFIIFIFSKRSYSFFFLLAVWFLLLFVIFDL